MSILRKMRKNITKRTFLFDTDMYTNPLGSLVITHYILSLMDGKPLGIEPLDIKKIKTTWASLKKHPKKVDFWIDDPSFIQKALALFEIDNIQYGRFAMVQGELNVLFAPYIDGEVLPLREDGFVPNTLRNGKIYPVEEKGEKDDKLETEERA